MALNSNHPSDPGQAKWLDSVFDRVKEYAVYAGLALGAGGAWALAGAALALQAVRHYLDFSFAASEHRVITQVARLPLSTQSALLVASAGEGAGMKAVGDAAAALGCGPDALAPAEAVGLVQLAGEGGQGAHQSVREDRECAPGR